MGGVDDKLSLDRLWADAEEALHDAAEYARIRDVQGAREKAEEALADLKTLEERGEA